MKDLKKEVERLSKNPVHAKEGMIFINPAFKRPSIQLDLKSFSERPFGSLFLFSPEEWVRVVEIMRAYFVQEERV